MYEYSILLGFKKIKEKTPNLNCIFFEEVLNLFLKDVVSLFLILKRIKIEQDKNRNLLN